MVRLDRTNLRLLELLQKDGRLSVVDLARSVRLAESTVRERIQALERGGVLIGCRALVEPHKIGYGVHAIIRAIVKPAGGTALDKALAAIPNVVRADMVTGPKPVRIEVWAADLQDLSRLVETRFLQCGLEQLEVVVLVRPLVPDRPVAIEVATDAREALPGALPMGTNGHNPHLMGDAEGGTTIQTDPLSRVP